MVLPPPERQRFVELNQLPISVRLGSYRADPLMWGFLSRRWWRNYLHTHSYFEICYVFAGHGTFTMLGRQYPVAAGDLFIAKPGEPHEIISSRKSVLGIYFWGYTLVSHTDQPSASAGAVDDLLDAFIRSTTWVSRRAAHAVEQTCRLLTEEIVRREPGFTQAIELLTTKLLLDTARAAVQGKVAAETVDPPGRSEAEAIAQTVIHYLRDNLARPIGLRDLAAHVHFSERHLNRLFRQVTGQPVGEFFTDLRIKAASQLLVDGELSIKQIARAVGYPDVRYFTTLFGRRIGQTPAAFRAAGGTHYIDGRKHVEE